MAKIKKFVSDFGIIEVHRSTSNGTITYFQNGSFHSQANKKGESIVAYVHVIVEIIRQSQKRNILILGSAGGTLATMLRRINCHVTAVDINSMAFGIARQHFGLPDSVRCVRRDGLSYLRRSHSRFDAIIVDIFGANNSIPTKFQSREFFSLVKYALYSSGLMIMNLMISDDKDRRGDLIARTAHSAFDKICLFDWPGEKDRNMLVVAGPLPRTRIPSGKEPHWISKELTQIKIRPPRNFTVFDDTSRI